MWKETHKNVFSSPDMAVFNHIEPLTSIEKGSKIQENNFRLEVRSMMDGEEGK